MKPEDLLIEVYDKREGITSSFYVVKLADNVFRMTENDIFNCRLTFGTEFETRTNKEGKYEIVRILKDSPFITRRFLLTPQFRASDYRLLGEEIIRTGGFWQVNFGGIATINIPHNSNLDIDKIFKIFDYKPTEIIE